MTKQCIRPGLVGTFKIDLGRAWLASSKMARKAGHFQTAYTSMLQARQLGTPYSFIQSCKLIHTEGDALRALQELNNALKDPKVDTVTTPTGVSLDVEEQMLQAKVTMLVSLRRYDLPTPIRLFSFGRVGHTKLGVPIQTTF